MFRYDDELSFRWQLTRNSLLARDKRMNLVNELFQNIRFLKFYGWGTVHPSHGHYIRLLDDLS